MERTFQGCQTSCQAYALSMSDMCENLNTVVTGLQNRCGQRGVREASNGPLCRSATVARYGKHNAFTVVTLQRQDNCTVLRRYFEFGTPTVYKKGVEKHDRDKNESHPLQSH